MARVKYISSRPNKQSKPIKTKSRPGYELVRDRHTGSYIEVPVKRLGQYTVELPEQSHSKQPELLRLGEYTVTSPDHCHFKQPELLQPQTFPYGLPTPPPEKQIPSPRKRRLSSDSDTEPFCLPPPALDLNVSTIYDSPLVAKLRRACQPTPSSSPEPVFKRKADDSQRDTLDSELSSAIETLIAPAREEHRGALDKYMKPGWNKEAAARAKEFWSKTYEPFNRGRQAHRHKFNYKSAMQQDQKCLRVKQKVDDRSSDTVSHDLICNGDIKRRRLSKGFHEEEWKVKGASSRPGEQYWPAWRKHREMEDMEHRKMFMGWEE
ncbi:MAG: hypothetical protein OHK93_007891 [Ramalina farinacea]|uniref:Uncharacterized protein n=1 Tax=Ramalina farinacea TaxID=258253 RepID=A0AA43QLD4_9LECA|nr:hypothetical protein [Ramalina farinacea]